MDKSFLKIACGARRSASAMTLALPESRKEQNVRGACGKRLN
jgi:hypothetical protein